VTSIPPFTRLTLSLQRRLLLSNLSQAFPRLAEAEAQIATGRRLLRPSSDPLATRLVLSHERAIATNNQFKSNADNALAQLGLTDSSLGSIEGLVIRARGIALEMQNATSSPDARRFAAQEVSQLLKQAISIANTAFAGRFIFSGAETETAPFHLDTEGVVSYRGDGRLQMSNISHGAVIPINVPGSEAFGAMDVQICSKDLYPIADGDTRLSDLNNSANGPLGVELGNFKVRVETSGGMMYFDIDISTAETLDDAASLIKDQTSGVLDARVTDYDTDYLIDGRPPGRLFIESNIAVTGTGLTITDNPGSKTASDLGIATPSFGTGTAIRVGDDINPAMTYFTKFSNLFHEQWTRLSPDGFTIRNGSLSADLDFNGVGTVGEMLKLINESGVGVTARISSNGSGIEMISDLSGARLTIIEGSGTTASDMSMILQLVDTPLSLLNDGAGVRLVTGADFRIQLPPGVTGVASGGDATTLVSPDLFNSTEIYANQRIYFLSGNNKGEVAIVDSFIPDNGFGEGEITFKSPLPDLVLAGDDFRVRTELDIDVGDAKTILTGAADGGDVLTLSSTDIYNKANISRGQTVYFLTGNNKGLTAVVDAYNPDNGFGQGEITFKSPLPTPVLLGDDFRLSSEDMSNSQTIPSVVNSINNHPDNDDGVGGRLVEAYLDEQNDWIVLKGMVEGSERFTVINLGGGFVASSLGLAGEPVSGLISPVGAGVNNAFIDTSLLDLRYNDVVGAAITIVGGANDGFTSTISDFNVITGEVTLAGAAPNPFTDGTYKASIIARDSIGPAGLLAENIFTALSTLVDGLEKDNSNIIDTALRYLGDAEGKMLATRANVGGRIQRVELATNFLDEENLALEALVSEQRDADIAEAIINFQMQQTLIQAALMTTGKILGTSLLDYL